ncbi:hypothetical protein [Rhodopirellula bahusiensis]|uniref:Uncharacterized protein n=1 Tax=Rhodopirellula bahusiensis TaxID=2014065 RepID=A0A2G1W272_9BACT|nr:hypothetical protein [Rhodopirellula bahusiensis]PHQ33122.1 hypothetical protein CEE69_21925 [Rhodopirellula bahusiensis]
MYERFIRPGMPAWPSMMFDDENKQAVISARIPSWETANRGRLASGVFALAFAPVAFLAVEILVPPIEPPITRWALVGFGTLIASMVGFRVLKSSLPKPLSRIVFARRLKIYVASDVVAFRSWFYDEGIRMDRFPGGEPLAIRPSIADDPEAAEYKASLPRDDGKEKKPGIHELETSKTLQLVLRSGPADRFDGENDCQGSVRTIPVASMNKETAENLVGLINVALEVTTPTLRSTSRDAVGLDLDRVADTRGGLG